MVDPIKCPPPKDATDEHIDYCDMYGNMPPADYVSSTTELVITYGIVLVIIFIVILLVMSCTQTKGQHHA